MCTLAGSGAADSVDSPIATAASFNWPSGVCLYPPNSIVVSGTYEHRLRIIHHNGSVGTLAGSSNGYDDSNDPLAARFSSPSGVCTDNEGNVLLSDSANHRIRTVLRNGSVRTLAGKAASGCTDSADPLQATFFHPYSIASIVENGQRLIIIGGNWDHRIRVIYANRTVSTLAGSGGVGNMWMIPIGQINCDFKDSPNPLDARFCHPMGVAQDRSGNIIVADQFSNRVRKVWRDGSQSGVTTIAGKGPVGASNGTSIDSDDPLGASFFTPFGVVIDGAGNILVSAYYEHRIRVILVNGSVRTLAGSGPDTDLSKSTEGGFTEDVPLLQTRFNYPIYLTIGRDSNAIVADSGNQRVRMLCTSLPVTTTSTITRSQAPPPQSFTSSGTGSLTSMPSATTLHSVTSTLTLTCSHTTTPTVSQLHALLPPSAPNPISRLVSSEEAARAVVASGAAAAALAGFAATASMGHATRMGALMRSVECAFASGELDPPSLVELPLQWSMESQGGSVGSHAGSALLTSAVLVVLPLLMCAFVHAILSSCGVSEQPMLRSLQSSVLSRYCLLSMAFFAPNVLMSSVVVVGRDASSGARCGCNIRCDRAPAAWVCCWAACSGDEC